MLEVLGELGPRRIDLPGNPLGGPHAVRRAIVPEQLASDGDLVDLGRAVGQAHDTGAMDHPEERHLIRRAERAMHLHRSPGDVVQHRRHDHLGNRDVLPHPLVVVVLVDLPSGVEHEQPELRELRVRVGDVALHELLVGEDAAGRLPAERALAHHVDRPLGHPDRPHGVVDASTAETGLRDHEGLPLATEQRFIRHPDILVVDEGMRALVQRVPPEADVALDVHAGRVGRDQEHRHALVRAHIGVRHRHDDEERRRLGVRREVLPAVDDPLAAVLDRPGLEQRRVGAGVRFGHRVGGEHLAVEQRLEIALLLLGSPVVGDDLGVAGVRRLTAEHDRRPLRPTEDLVEQCQLQLAVTLTAQLRTEMGSPQPLTPHLVLQRVDDLAPGPVQRHELLVRKHEVERLDLGTNELVSPVELLLVLGVGFKIPCHCGLPPGTVRIQF